MAYNFETTPQRSNIMKKIRGINTGPEVMLRKGLWEKGIRYRKNYNKLPGKPDILITKNKIAIFVDGEFWHGHNWEEKKCRIKSNRDYWIKKIERNIERDKENTKKLEELGFVVIRFWEKEVKNDLQSCVQKIIDLTENQ
ncbi:very short patch repair endonuclease [Candidatus Contubernalis alkaliaceticus]|uniref:very short patch repair endonuclease n=1 Tax=Candidatus Contubernalis alkaliaceticus TaxID=338645 RepID=UPI001F4BE051|nr:very short patch repair endonuclease [Candidatus Contubernalis alkalaceticus]UNC91288.1 very short patch repair endonuclease [Candidatus Contubernalis alkalaceticus]